MPIVQFLPVIAALLLQLRTRLAIALAAAGFALAACAAPPGDESAYATQVQSARATFVLSYAADATPVPVGRMHTWKLHVANSDGSPVTDAAVDVDGDMPQHGHGLPTRPRVTRNLGNGDYLVEGVKFQMGGWWVMDFRIRSGERTDTARFNLRLQRD